MAAVSGGVATATSPSPSAGPATPDTIVLQMSSCCGFVPVSYRLLTMPVVTLYADGTVIYRPASDDITYNAPVMELAPLMQAQLSQAQTDELIAYALGPGGLANAKPTYDQFFVTDMPTTTFVVHDGGVSKVVAVYALGVENPDPTEDAEELAQLAALGQELSDFGPHLEQMGVTSTEYQPSTYLATLYPDFEGNTEPASPWPFTDFEPSDFTADQQDLPVAVLTAEQVAQVTEVPSGGVAGLLFTAPDGTRTNMVIRPMLPGEPTPSAAAGSPVPSAKA